MTDRTPEARHGRPAGSVRYVCFAALLAVVALSAVQTFVLPRPFYVWENDYDNGFYYNARALYHGLPIHNVEHPGTPVIVLERLLMTPTTARLDHMQSFLNELYLVVGLAYCASIGLFCLLVLRRFSAGVGALALSSLAAWPPFLMHMNYYCTDSFVLVVGLVAISGFWMLLESFPRPSLRQVFFVGTACGACIAIKLSFLPFVLALEVATVVSLLRCDTRPRLKIVNVLVLCSATAAAFLISIIPVIYRLDEIVFHTLKRRDVRIPDEALRALGRSGWALLKESPAFVALFVVFSVLVLIGAMRRILLAKGETPPGANGIEGFDDLAGLTFVILLSCSFIYTLACAAPDLVYSYSVGNSLRNASPSALVVPFMILHVARISAGSRGVGRVSEAAKPRFLLAAALLVACLSIALHIVVRGEMIRGRLRDVVETKARLEELGRQYGLVAFWDKLLMGEASFHFWGNYRYAGSYFDDELLDKFKGYSWLDLRDVQRGPEPPPGAKATAAPRAGPSPGVSGKTARPLWMSFLHRFHQWWLAMTAHCPAFPERPPMLFAGQDRGIRVGLLAFSEWSAETEVYQRLGWKESDLKARLERSLGPLNLWKERIGRREWVFLTPVGSVRNVPPVGGESSARVSLTKIARQRTSKR